MALGSIAGALATGAATAAGGSLASRLFGGSKKSSSKGTPSTFTPPRFTAGGLKADYKGGRTTVTSLPERMNLVDSVSRTFLNQAGEVAGLRSRVAPGMSDLRRVRMNEIEDSRRVAVGNLRDNLQARRVLGSSFAADALSRTEAEFARDRERVAAESFLQELELTNNLLVQEYDTTRASYQTRLAEMNLQADIAASLSGKTSTGLGEAARFEMELAAKEAAGAGKFFGDAFQPAFKALGDAVSVALSGK